MTDFVDPLQDSEQFAREIGHRPPNEHLNRMFFVPIPLGVPVFEETGLNGTYNFSLEFTDPRDGARGSPTLLLMYSQRSRINSDLNCARLSDQSQSS